MKTFYRKGYGCFVETDVYYRPWWYTFRQYMKPRPSRSAFILSFLASLLLAIFITSI